MKARQTIYRGIIFRSMLEARWAVLFDLIGIRFEYEPKQFKTPHGFYLPDFYLPELGVWIEIKPDAESGPTESEMQKAAAVAKAECKPCILICGFPIDENGWNNFYLFLPNGKVWQEYFQAVYLRAPEDHQLMYFCAAASAKAKVRNGSASFLPDAVFSLLVEIGLVDRYIHNPEIQKSPRESFAQSLPMFAELRDYIFAKASELHDAIEDLKRRLA